MNIIRISHKKQYAQKAYYRILTGDNMRRLRDLREDRDLKQKDLAEILHCSQTTYSRYENGRLSVPIDVLKQLALFYHVSIDYLTDFTDIKKHYARKEG